MEQKEKILDVKKIITGVQEPMHGGILGISGGSRPEQAFSDTLLSNRPSTVVWGNPAQISVPNTGESVRSSFLGGHEPPVFYRMGDYQETQDTRKVIDNEIIHNDYNTDYTINNTKLRGVGDAKDFSVKQVDANGNLTGVVLDGQEYVERMWVPEPMIDRDMALLHR